MSTLHTVNKSAYERNALKSCLDHALPGDVVLLIEDGVYAARKGGAFAPALTAAQGGCKIYALGPDLAARGIVAGEVLARNRNRRLRRFRRFGGGRHARLRLALNCEHKTENKMSGYDVNGTAVEHDEEGYLTDIGQWTKDVGDIIAKAEKIDMTDEHWVVVNFLRDYYDEYQIAPAVRILVKEMTKKYGKDKGDQKALYALFPYGPAKQACKIAGLPKPTGCI